MNTMLNKVTEFFSDYDYEVRLVRLNLTIIGYLTYSFSTMYFGQHPWNECVTIDKIISVVSIIFIVQHLFLRINDLPIKLKICYYLSIIIFAYIHFIK